MLIRAQTQYRIDIVWCDSLSETVFVCHRQNLEHQNIIACMLQQQVVGSKCTDLKSMVM